MIVVHGKNDVSIPIELVRNDVKATGDSRMKFIELENDNHSAESIFQNGHIKNLIEEVYELQFVKLDTSTKPKVQSNTHSSLMSAIKLRKI